MNTFATVIICMTLWGICAGCERQDDLGVRLYSEVRSADKIVLAQMAISKMATVDDLRLSDANGLKETLAALGDAVKIGDRKAAYSYDTYLRAYIDMSALRPEDVSVDRRTSTVTLTLPPVQTEFAGRDMEIREEHYRVTGLRSSINAAERAAVKESMNAALKEEVERNSGFRERLEAQARSKARSYFTSVLAGLPEGYNVVVKFR